VKGIEEGSNSGRRFPVEEVTTEVEGGADRWGPPVGVKRKGKEKEGKAERGCGLRPAGLLLGLGPRVRPSWAVPFFFPPFLF
jgi:hypothetical protein